MSLDVRELLDRSAADAPPSDWALDDVIRRARAARVRRHRLVAAGVSAALIIGVGAAVVGPRTGGTEVLPTGPAAPATSAPAAEVPEAVDAAFVRAAAVLTGRGITVTSDVPAITDYGASVRWDVSKNDAHSEVEVSLGADAARADGLGERCKSLRRDDVTTTVWSDGRLECTLEQFGIADAKDGFGYSMSEWSVREIHGAQEWYVHTRTYDGGGWVEVREAQGPDQRLVGSGRLEAMASAIGNPSGWFQAVSVPIPSLEVPEVVDGEVARAVLSDSSVSRTGTPVTSVTYVVRAACMATDRSDELQYEVRDDSANGKFAVVTSGSVPCDGTLVQNTASPLPAHRLSIGLDGPAGASGYAVLVPYPALAEQQKQNREDEAKQQRDKTQQDAQEQQDARQHPCAAGDLSAAARRVEGGMQTYADVLTFTNTSGTACGVSGVPTVRLVAGERMEAEPLGFSYTPGQYMIFLPDASDHPVLIRPREAAYVYLSKPGCAETTEAVARMAVVTVAGEEVDVRLPRSGQGALAYCGPAADDPGNLVRVTSFQARAPQ